MDKGWTQTNGPENNKCIRPYITEMTKRDYMFHEKKDEEDSPILKIEGMFQYKVSTTTIKRTKKD